MNKKIIDSDKSECRLLCDPSEAYALMDPVGATYSFVIIKNGEIIEREPPRSGFDNNAKEQLRDLLNNQIKALDKPIIYERVQLVEEA